MKQNLISYKYVHIFLTIILQFIYTHHSSKPLEDEFLQNPINDEK